MVGYVPSNFPAQGAFGSAASSPVTDVVGAGTWSLALFAEDGAFNASANSGSLTVTAGFDASVASAAAPTWEQAVTNDAYLNLLWPDDGADSWVVTQRALDGGWLISVRPRVSGPGALLAVPGPCRRHAARIARVLGDQVSDWSVPSADLLSDTVAPVPFAPSLAGVDGGQAMLSWIAAMDGCPSGLTYRLERSENGAAFVARATTANTQAVDALDVTGVLRWRLVAIDGAGNLGISDGGASFTVVDPADGGADDAGIDDGGVSDGGVSDGGEGFEDGGADPSAPRRLSVGCGCEGGGSGFFLAALVLVIRRPSPRPSPPRGEGARSQPSSI